MRPKTLTTAITVAAMTLKISARLKIDTKNTDHTKRCDQHDSSTFVQKNKDARVHYAVPKQQPPPPSPTLNEQGRLPEAETDHETTIVVSGPNSVPSTIHKSTSSLSDP